MSQLKSNPRTNFIRPVDHPYIRYAGPYEDEYGNMWTVSILGLSEDVMSIMGERTFLLNAIPEEDHEAFQAHIDRVALLEKDREGHDNNDDGGVPQIPGLLVEIELKEIIRSDQQHVIQIEFDPKIWDNSHYWRIILNSPQQDFFFSFTATRGSVTWTSFMSRGGIQWDAIVTRVTGNPAQYDNKCAAFPV